MCNMAIYVEVKAVPVSESESQSLIKTTELLDHLSKDYSQCPVCGLDYTALREMLTSPSWEDRITAELLIRNDINCRTVSNG